MNSCKIDFSGGNKRKLSTAIALVGDPRVICLDEPTSGMDAKARRLLWNDILSLIKENRIVILTSHSMEECEALCTRLVIMVNGEFKCLGSPQHLKSKFGNGYKLSIRLNNETNNETLFQFMNENFPTSINTETHKDLFEYILPFNSTKLSQIFGKIEKNRELLNIKDYSITQTTLDQIFVNFARSQKEDSLKDEDEDEQEQLQLPFTSLKSQISVIDLHNNNDSNNNYNNGPKASTFSSTNLDSFNSELKQRLSQISQNIDDSLVQQRGGISCDEDQKIEEENLDETKEKIYLNAYDSKYYEDLPIDFFPKPLEFGKIDNTASTSF